MARPHYCLFCFKPQKQLQRHMEIVHKTKPELQALAVLSKDEKKKALKILVNKGDHTHNKQTVANGEGTLIIARSPDESFAQPLHYGPCKFCWLWIRLDQLHRHQADDHCPFKPKDAPEEAPKDIRRASKKMVIAVVPTGQKQTKLDKHVESVLLGLQSDRIGTICQSDDLLLVFARNRLKNKVYEERHIHSTRQRIRELAQLIAHLQDHLEDQTLKLRQLIDKKYFNIIMDTIRSSCLDRNLNQKAIQTCFSLDDCAELLLVTAIEHDQEELEIRAQKFMTMYKMRANTEIISKAKKQKKIVHGKKDIEVIDNEDVSNFLTGLNSDIMTVTTKFMKSTTKVLWEELRDLCFTYIASFNR